MPCGRLVFASAGEPREVVERALEYDVALLVGDDVELIERARVYGEYGVDARIYPLSSRDSPTIYSLLGIVGLLREYVEECKSVIVEGYGGEALLRAAYDIVFGAAGSSAQADEVIRGVVESLQSPLHLRSLVMLSLLAAGGLDLAAEARRNIAHAFTGGDAHKSDVIEHVGDIAVAVGDERLTVCPAIAYKYYAGILPLARVPAHCREVMEASEALDASRAGFVKCIAISEGGDAAEVYVGCKLLSWDECFREVGEGLEALAGLIGRLLGGAKRIKVDIVDPEEAACIGYGLRYGYPCS